GVPSFHELGFADFEAPTWWGVYAPSGVPREIQSRMARELTTILAEPEIKSRVEALGMDVLATSGEPFADFMVSEMERWARVVRENNIRLEG
ncbi:Bug family tripartite tricarboxylate transporter substrate binding protein, partial [Roseococcus thiosulfatophilus]